MSVSPDSHRLLSTTIGGHQPSAPALHVCSRVLFVRRVPELQEQVEGLNAKREEERKRADELQAEADGAAANNSKVYVDR